MQNTPTYEELLALYQSEKSKNEILNKVLQEKDDELSKLRKEMRIANLLLFEFLKKSRIKI